MFPHALTHHIYIIAPPTHSGSHTDWSYSGLSVLPWDWSKPAGPEIKPSKHSSLKANHSPK